MRGEEEGGEGREGLGQVLQGLWVEMRTLSPLSEMGMWGVSEQISAITISSPTLHPMLCEAK